MGYGLWGRGRVEGRVGESGFGEDPFDGAAREFGGGGDAEFFLDALAVGFDGFDGDAEAVGDFAGAEAGADEFEGFHFAIGELVDVRAGGRGGAAGAGEALEDATDDGRVEVDITG